MIEILLKSTICLGLGGLLAQRVARSRPAVSHVIWVVLFAGALLVPLLSTELGPRIDVSIPIGTPLQEIPRPGIETVVPDTTIDPPLWQLRLKPRTKSSRPSLPS